MGSHGVLLLVMVQSAAAKLSSGGGAVQRHHPPDSGKEDGWSFKVQDGQEFKQNVVGSHGVRDYTLVQDRHFCFQNDHVRHVLPRT